MSVSYFKILINVLVSHISEDGSAMSVYFHISEDGSAMSVYLTVCRLTGTFARFFYLSQTRLKSN